MGDVISARRTARKTVFSLNPSDEVKIETKFWEPRQHFPSCVLLVVCDGRDVAISSARRFYFFFMHFSAGMVLTKLGGTVHRIEIRMYKTLHWT